MKIVLIVLVIAVLAGAGWYVFRGRSSTPEQTPTPVVEQPTDITESNAPEVSVQPSATPTPTPSSSAVKSFTIVGTNYLFTPNAITVKKGDHVKITFQDDGGTHNLTIDGFNVKTSTISSGTTTAEFDATKTGTFTFYCAVDSHRAKGMVGTLTVK